jgi:hypothetical protein
MLPLVSQLTVSLYTTTAGVGVPATEGYALCLRNGRIIMPYCQVLVIHVMNAGLGAAVLQLDVYLAT